MNGSCLCKAVSYRIARLASGIVHCHCMTCQKAHSAVFASTARVNREDFHWLGGEQHLRSFESTPGKLRWFCGNCGSHLMAEWLDKPYMIIRVATLDEDPGVDAKAHIWVSHDRLWLHTSNKIPAYSETPSD